ncbi:MAG TPA: lysophospholipid acyltransferase family protein [Planctomycetota bacterium]|jgi:hypothetical protein|nr:lysophospholipid acyltransferase family protein [Planctomycetota bacterium]OQC19916.1 MAG: hypothetical protein BWX69_02306 [Planctomycetes bacterium ADurb.Bin069]HNR99824.1 lysophospholipid acyltransferase family protein [Planctomycetota bacterium]HNU26297.1 lysophospholipid acyltransferase family protein [Planctomycetota bacterium]HOE28880.1 lysophospholipid acyltransferase family protein [Planctomycetota bacterium]
MARFDALLAAVPRIAPALIRLYLGTLRIRWLGIEPLDPPIGLRGPCIYAFWHQRMLLFTYTHRFQRVTIIVSRHRDGDLIARTVERLGFGTVRGSSTRGGGPALFRLCRRRDVDLAVTPDGPRGPRHELKPGVIRLAAETGYPIIPATCSFARFKQFRSWDGFLLPYPFTRALVRTSAAFRVPAAPTDNLEPFRARLEGILRELTRETDRDFATLWARARPAPPYGLRADRRFTCS